MPWSIEQEEQLIKKLAEESDDEALTKLKAWLSPKTAGFYRSAKSGARLHTRTVLPPGDQACCTVQASIFYCHGLNAHVNGKHLVTDLLPRIAAKGFAVFAMDIIGHGYSEGERALVEDWNDVFDDLEGFATALLCEERESNPKDVNFDLGSEALARIRKLPAFVIGESMGGMMSMYLALRMQKSALLAKKLHGVVLFCPALSVSLPPKLVRYVLRGLVVPLFKLREMPQGMSSSTQAPKSCIFNMDDPRQLEIVEQQERDCASRFPGIGCGWGKNMLWGTAGAFSDLFSHMEDDMAQVEFPFLVIHDPGDKVCYINGSERLLELSKSQDKKLESMNNGGFHALVFVDPELYVEKLAIPWMKERL